MSINQSLIIGIMIGLIILAIPILDYSLQVKRCDDYSELNNVDVKLIHGVCYARTKTGYMSINNIRSEN